MKASQPSWVNIVENEEEREGEGFIILPQPKVTKKPGGIKETVSFKEKDGGGFVKVIESTRTIKAKRRVSRKAKSRRRIPKFGVCQGQPLNTPERGVTAQSIDPVLFEWEHERQPDDEEDENRVLARMLQKSEQEQLVQDIVPEHIYKESMITKQRPKTRAYDSHKRGHQNQIENTPTIRILDLPTTTQFSDLLNLVSMFHSRKIKLPRDQDRENHNRGFAFVTFDSHNDALRAMKSLNGHAYGTNILHAEWSRNYKNYLEANPEERQLIDAREGMGGFAPRRGAGRPRFTNSKKGKVGGPKKL